MRIRERCRTGGRRARVRTGPGVAAALVLGAVMTCGAAAPALAAPAASAAPLSPEQRGASCEGASRVRCSWAQDGFLTVPLGVTRVHVEASGGAGGDGGPRPGSTGASGDGGRGTRVSGDVAVVAGQRLDVVLGRRGTDGRSRNAVPGGAGAGRGGSGGYGDSAGGAGGGASRVGTGGVAAVVAAGGGGGGGKGSPTSRGGDGEASGPSTATADGGAGVRARYGESGSGGGGGGVRGGQAGEPGDDGFFYSSGSHGGHAGTSLAPSGARIDPALRAGDGAVVISFDDPGIRPARPEVATTVQAPPRPAAGRPFTLLVTVTNRGSTTIDSTETELFSHSFQFVDSDSARRIDLTTGPLAPGASASEQVRAVPLGVGRTFISTVTVAHGPGGAGTDRGGVLITTSFPDG